MKSLLTLALSLCLLGTAAAQDRVARVGYLSWRDSGAYYEATLKGFREGLRSEGFVEGKNLELMRRSASNDPERFKPLARELVTAKVDVFFAPATPMATAAWYADNNTPIVIASIMDPVELKFVNRQAKAIAEFAARQRVPSISGWPEFAHAGNLMSYGPNRYDFYLDIAKHVDKLLRGGKAADMPVEQPTRFELVVNLKAAHAIGTTIPQSLLLRADEVIQ